MAGKKPAFITGANAKIKMGNITIAYAQDVSYSATVTTIPIETMGRYEVVSNEPVAYFVEGTLSVIRYTSQAALSGIDKVGTDGNGVGKMAPGTGGDGGQHFNPGQLLASQTWDLYVHQKLENSGQTDAVITLTDCRFIRKGGSITKRGVLVEQFQFNAILAGDDSLNPSGSGDTDLS
jgi:hypothetical protein